jgi:hypothetical protein
MKGLGNYSICLVWCPKSGKFVLASPLTQIAVGPVLVLLWEWLPRCPITESVYCRVQSLPGNVRSKVALPPTAVGCLERILSFAGLVALCGE